MAIGFIDNNSWLEAFLQTTTESFIALAERLILRLKIVAKNMLYALYLSGSTKLSPGKKCLSKYYGIIHSFYYGIIHSSL